MSRARGRPPRGVAGLTRDDILCEALALLEEKGVEGFTMRALAARLGVTAMSLYHHVSDREALVAALADRAYAGVSAPGSGTPRARIEALLRTYHDVVRRHPGLTLLVFASPAVFPDQARRITETLSHLLVEEGLAPQAARLWVGILVDFTHGAAIAIAMTRRSGAASPGLEDDAYGAALAALLSALNDADSGP